MDCPLDEQNPPFDLNDCYQCTQYMRCAEMYATWTRFTRQKEEDRANEREFDRTIESLAPGFIGQIEGFLLYYTDARKQRGYTRQEAIKFANYCLREGG